MLAMEMKTTGAFVSRGLSFKHSEVSITLTDVCNFSVMRQVLCSVWNCGGGTDNGAGEVI